MTVSEFQYRIEKQIKGLSDYGRLKFAFHICRRLLPGYETFYQKYQWGNPDILTNGIQYCEKILDGEKTDSDQIERIKKSIETVTPDMDEFGDWDGSYALNACVALLETLEFIHDKNINHIINVSSQMTDTTDFKISQTFGDLASEAIDAHAWMISERNNQIELVNNVAQQKI